MPNRVTQLRAAAGLERRHTPVEVQTGSQLNELLRLAGEIAAALKAIAEVVEQQTERRALESQHPGDIRDGIDFNEAVRRFEVDLIERALREVGGNQVQAARLLGLKHTTLHDKIRRYRIKGAARRSLSVPDSVAKKI